MNKHKKLAQKCQVCGEYPAYYSKMANSYLCQKHAARAIRKILAAMVVISIILIILGL